MLTRRAKRPLGFDVSSGLRSGSSVHCREGCAAARLPPKGSAAISEDSATIKPRKLNHEWRGAAARKSSGCALGGVTRRSGPRVSSSLAWSSLVTRVRCPGDPTACHAVRRWSGRRHPSAACTPASDTPATTPTPARRGRPWVAPGTLTEVYTNWTRRASLKPRTDAGSRPRARIRLDSRCRATPFR